MTLLLIMCIENIRGKNIITKKQGGWCEQAFNYNNNHLFICNCVCVKGKSVSCKLFIFIIS